MRYLLDTNVVSELRKSPHRVDPAVTGWAAARELDGLFVSVVTIFELELGVRRQERRDPPQGHRLRAWLDRDVVAAFRDRTLELDLPIARRAAALHVPDPRPDRDAFLAATALVHELTMATRNEADFTPLGVPVVNPWTAAH